MKKRIPAQVPRRLRSGKRPQGTQHIPSDVQGSYTGVPLDGEQPVQDADDL